MSPPVGSPFVRKLYRILQDGGFPGIISWNVSGTAFSVFSMDQLEQVVLPHYFRGRLDAFHQQLREHGFDRVLVTEASLAVESYQHPMFVRGNPNGLINIVRVQLPRKRTRRKKTAAGATMDISDVVVKTEPDDQDYLATMFAELDASDAGNSMNLKFSLDEERFNVLSWLEEPTVDDSVPLNVEDVAAISELAESMSQDDVDVVLRALSDGDGTGFVNLQSSSCPAPPMHENMLINEFPVDMLHTLLERFSSAVPT